MEAISEPRWSDAPVDRSFASSQQVHVWRAFRANHTASLPSLRGYLSVDEQARADRFLSPADRDGFIIARGLLRTLLASYWDVNPASLQFVYNPQGKPALAQTEGRSPLGFNLSHARDVVVVAVTPGRQVGIDVEYARALQNLDDMARVAFSPEELRSFLATPAAAKQAVFYRTWTRKEAIVKALGTGLAAAADSFTVPVEGDEVVQVRLGQVWSLQPVPVNWPYVGALAVEGNTLEVRYFAADRLLDGK